MEQHDCQNCQAELESLRAQLMQAQKMGSVGSLASSITHEFNNILTPMQSYAKLALQRPDDPKLVEKALRHTLEGCERAAAVSTSILRTSSSSSGERPSRILFAATFRLRAVFDFASQLLGLDSRIYLTLSRALDPFGNPVDDDGESLDPRGRRIDIERYVTVDGEPTIVPQRDMEYTRELGVKIAEAFSRDNVVQSTNVLARAVFTLLRLKNPQTDLVRLLRVGGHHEDMELREVYHEVGRLLDELRGLAGRGGIRLGEKVQMSSAEDVVALHGSLKQAGHAVSDPAVRFYGMKEIELVDPDGHVLIFAQDTDEPPTPEPPPAD